MAEYDELTTLCIYKTVQAALNGVRESFNVTQPNVRALDPAERTVVGSMLAEIESRTGYKCNFLPSAEGMPAMVLTHDNYRVVLTDGFWQLQTNGGWIDI